MTTHLQRPDPREYNPKFESEIASVPDAADFLGLIREQANATVRFMTAEFGEEHADLSYGPGKWTAREVIGHLSIARQRRLASWTDSPTSLPLASATSPAEPCPRGR